VTVAGVVITGVAVVLVIAGVLFFARRAAPGNDRQRALRRVLAIIGVGLAIGLVYGLIRSMS